MRQQMAEAAIILEAVVITVWFIVYVTGVVKV